MFKNHLTNVTSKVNKVRTRNKLINETPVLDVIYFHYMSHFINE